MKTPAQRAALAACFVPPKADIVLLRLRSPYAAGSALAFDFTPRGRQWLHSRITAPAGTVRRIEHKLIPLYQALAEQDGLKVEVR